MEDRAKVAGEKAQLYRAASDAVFALHAAIEKLWQQNAGRVGVVVAGLMALPVFVRGFGKNEA